MKEAVSIATNDFYLQAKTSIVDNLKFSIDDKAVTVSITMPMKDIGKIICDDNTLDKNDGDMINAVTVKKLVGKYATALTSAKEFKENNPNIYVITPADYERLSRKYASNKD